MTVGVGETPSRIPKVIPSPYTYPPHRSEYSSAGISHPKILMLAVIPHHGSSRLLRSHPDDSRSQSHSHFARTELWCLAPRQLLFAFLASRTRLSTQRTAPRVPHHVRSTGRRCAAVQVSSKAPSCLSACVVPSSVRLIKQPFSPRILKHSWKLPPFYSSPSKSVVGLRRARCSRSFARSDRHHIGPARLVMNKETGVRFGFD